jgi:hypothetical protein
MQRDYTNCRYTVSDAYKRSALYPEICPALTVSVSQVHMLCESQTSDVKSGSQRRWILPQLGFQFDSEAENRTTNFHSSFKDPDLSKRDQDPN